MQVDDVRHDGRAEDADGEQDRLAPGELREDGVLRGQPQRRVRVEELAEVADADQQHHHGDHRLERAEAEALQAEDQEGGDAREHGGREQGDAEQQMEADRRPEELGQVGRHGDRLGLEPEAERDAAREFLAADLGQVASGGDPELRREHLDQHRHQVRGDDHPEQRVAELRATGDVGREVARVDVGDAGDERGPEEGQDPEHPLAGAERP